MITFDLDSFDFERVWLTSDLHLGHQIVLDKSQRPWKNTDRMDNALLRNLQVVGEKDLLIIVGDLTMDGSDKADRVRRWIDKITGTKILVAHDPAFAQVWSEDAPVLCGHVH